MTTEYPPRLYRTRTIIFGTMAIAVYALMVAVTLPHLESLADAPALDMRPTGYSRDEVLALFTALGEAGRSFYLTRQLPLDLFYPSLLALTLSHAFLWCHRVRAVPRLLPIGLGLSGLAAAADYAENLGIVAMLISWPALPDWMVTATSSASVTKGILTTCAMILLLGVIVRTRFAAKNRGSLLRSTNALEERVQ